MKKMIDRRGFWMQTFSGRQFFPLDPRPEEVYIEDIAHALSQQCRYNGHTTRFYSVAEHSVVVSRYVPPEYAAHGLLHDAAEAYVGDVIRAIKDSPEMTGYKAIEDRVTDAVNEHFGLVWTPEAHAAVKEIDNRILVDERDQVMSTPPASWWAENMEPLGTVLGLSAEQAEEAFLRRFKELTKRRK